MLHARMWNTIPVESLYMTTKHGRNLGSMTPRTKRRVTFHRHSTIIAKLLKCCWNEKQIEAVNLYLEAHMVHSMILWIIGAGFITPVLFSTVLGLNDKAVASLCGLTCIFALPLNLTCTSLINVQLAKLVLQKFQFWFLFSCTLIVSVLMNVVCMNNGRWLVWWIGVGWGYTYSLMADAIPYRFFPKVKFGLVCIQIAAFLFMSTLYLSVLFHLQPVDNVKISIPTRLANSTSFVAFDGQWKYEAYKLSGQCQCRYNKTIIWEIELKEIFSCISFL